jgi:hypothetical protein
MNERTDRPNVCVYTLDVHIIGIGQPQGLPLQSVRRGNPCGCPFIQEIQKLERLEYTYSIIPPSFTTTPTIASTDQLC